MEENKMKGPISSTGAFPGTPTPVEEFEDDDIDLQKGEIMGDVVISGTKKISARIPLRYIFEIRRISKEKNVLATTLVRAILMNYLDKRRDKIEKFEYRKRGAKLNE